MDGRVSLSIYQSDAHAPIQPTTRIYTRECFGQAFGLPGYEETGLSIPVAAGSALWFTVHETAAPKAEPLAGAAWWLAPSQLSCYLGTTILPLSPGAGGAPIKAIKKTGVVYSYPPPATFPTVLAADLVVRTQTISVPTMLFKFTPS
jgi:hypothetical protein